MNKEAPDALNGTVFLNGTFIRGDTARASVFDRGLPFGDGIYEVTAAANGHLIDFDLHIDRPFRSAAEIGLTAPLSKTEQRQAHERLISTSDGQFAGSRRTARIGMEVANA